MQNLENMGVTSSEPTAFIPFWDLVLEVSTWIVKDLILPLR